MCDNETHDIVRDEGTDNEVSSTHEGENEGTNEETVSAMGSEHFTSIQEMMERQMNGLWRCLKCGYTLRKKTDVRIHTQSVHRTTARISCDTCGKICPSNKALTIHKERYHKQDTPCVTNIETSVLREDTQASLCIHNTSIERHIPQVYSDVETTQSLIGPTPPVVTLPP